MLQGKPARCSHGNQIRDFLYVQDVADAFVALVESNVSGPINIASGRPVALKDVVYRIARKLDRPDLVCLGVIPVPENEPHLLIADTTRLSNEVGWFPNYDLDHGLKEAISWWANQLEKSA
jgi:nucleoside-diphosphate-sugar epimerase